MSINSAPVNEPKNRPEDIEAARELIKGTLLENDPRTQFILDHEGMAPDGVEVDVGNYAAAQLEKLKKESNPEKLTDLKKRNLSDVGVTHSVRGDVEKYTEGGK